MTTSMRALLSTGRRAMEARYRHAESRFDLPWHQDDTPALLKRVAVSRGRGRRALDIGCGAGENALYLASQGFDVTAIDIVPKAIDMTGRLSSGLGCNIQLINVDVLSWAPGHGFDLVLDSGCLHCLGKRASHRYRTQILAWLRPGADYLLIHFVRRGRLDWRPVGPYRRYERDLIALWAPDLQVQEKALDVVPTPLLMGPRSLVGQYWFRRTLESAA